MVEVLKQDKHVPLPFEKQVAIIYAAGAGVFDDADKTKVSELEGAFFALLESQYPEVLKTIADSRDLSDASQATLKDAAATLKNANPELFVPK
jgi:F-type H+-transporting ATPase subunit alpha